MSNTNTGGPAFPGLHPSSECRYQEEGMTLRDYFASKAMQGWLSTYPVDQGPEVVYEDGLAEFAYKMADAMLKAREA